MPVSGLHVCQEYTDIFRVNIWVPDAYTSPIFSDGRLQKLLLSEYL